MRRRNRGDGRRSIFRIPHRADMQDVVLQQLEHDAELQSRRDVSENRPSNRPGDERPRDHRLRQAHEIDAYERAPNEQGEQNLNGQVHVKSPTGTARAVGTSCAVTSIPRAASWRSFAASSSVRYTKRRRSFRPVRWCTPPTLNRLTCGTRPASATAVSISPTSRIPTPASDSQPG